MRFKTLSGVTLQCRMHAQMQALSTMYGRGRSVFLWYFRLFHLHSRCTVHVRCVHAMGMANACMDLVRIRKRREHQHPCRAESLACSSFQHARASMPIKHETSHLPLYLVVQYSRLRLSLCLLPLCRRCACSPRRCPCRATRFSSTELPSPRPWRYFPGE